MIVLFLVLIILTIILQMKYGLRRIQKPYGKPLFYFWCSSWYAKYQITALNLTLISFFEDYLIISRHGEDLVINKENFLEFKEPTFLKGCYIKLKVNTIEKTKTIYFSIIRKKEIKKMKEFIDKIACLLDDTEHKK